MQPAVNVASMIGLGSVRGAVVGANNRPATAAEIRRMAALVQRALADGACGASSGLEYTPGAFASQAELIALCRPLAARRLPYATHMRNEDDRLLDSTMNPAERACRRRLQLGPETQGPAIGIAGHCLCPTGCARKAGLEWRSTATRTSRTDRTSNLFRAGAVWWYAAFLAATGSHRRRQRIKHSFRQGRADVGGYVQVLGAPAEMRKRGAARRYAQSSAAIVRAGVALLSVTVARQLVVFAL